MHSWVPDRGRWAGGTYQCLAFALARLPGKEGAPPARDHMLQGRQILDEGVGIKVNADLLALILSSHPICLVLIVSAHALQWSDRQTCPAYGTGSQGS